METMQEIEEIVEDVEIVEKPRKWTGRDGKTELKHQAAVILAENGLGYGAIAKVLDRSVHTVKKVIPKLRRESLLHPHKVKLASKCIEAVMEGFVGAKDKNGNIIKDKRVKASDAMRASELTYSRYEPLKPDVQQAPQMFFQVNNQYFERHDRQALPHVVSSTQNDADKLPE